MNDGTTRFTCRDQPIKHNLVINLNCFPQTKSNKLFFLKGLFNFQRVYCGARDKRLQGAKSSAKLWEFLIG